jgi:hypothetical protein
MIAWTLVAVVLFVLGMLMVEELLGFLSFLAAGFAVASGVVTYRSRLRVPGTNREHQLAHLQERLDHAETEIERLRAEADFDRKLVRPRDG